MDNPVTRQELSTRQKECYETNIHPIMEEIKTLGKQLNDFKLEVTKSLAEMPEKLEEKFDERYASKTSEKVVYAIVGAIVMGVVGAGMTIILR